MTTLAAIRQQMLALEPRLLGRVLTPSAFGAQTVTVPDLASGTVGTTAYSGQFILRPGAATALGADRSRIVTETGYASATGVLTHAGAAYTDTTVGSELVELLKFPPHYYDRAINEALRQCRRIDSVYFQSRPDGRYDLAAYDWLDEPSLIVKFGTRGLPILTPNRHLDSWGQVHTDGTLRPDGLTLSGTAAVFARSTTTRRGRYSLSIQRVGNDALVAVTIPVRFSDAPDDDYRGEYVTGTLVGRSAQASSMRVRMTSENASGTVLTTTNSAYHTGGGAWEEVTEEHQVHASAEQLTISARLEVNETALLDELHLDLVNGITDEIRRDSAPVDWLQRPYDYQQNPLVWLGPRERGRQVVMESRRAFPAFDTTRLAGGTADSDTTDCPLDLAAYKALACFFAARGVENARMAKLADEYGAKADALQMQHIKEQTTAQQGAPMVSGRAYGVRQGVR